jgi:hypothetical protein
MDRPAAEDPHDPDDQGDADSQSNRQAQLKGVGKAGIFDFRYEPCLAGDLSGLGGDRNQRRLGGGRAESQAEGKGEQRREATFAGEGFGHALAQRKQPDLEALHEERQANDDAG